ncbi:PQQ-binding-like beta-propeller repeat protein [Alcanivorax sp.]|uniref:PQQ-binding-like beta-propeller repeat protein n=1 Tax=Alcanivorax sp. TaxID=1872427 RepID=UPI0025BD0A1A|nr:PQQ-binding-like beta-propeller repeat protein [Alcanivorax sp.]
MSYRRNLPWATLLVAVMALAGCGGSGSSAGAAPVSQVRAVPDADVPADPPPASPADGFCQEMDVDFSASPEASVSELPGVMKRFVKHQDQTPLSHFSQLSLASRSPAIQSSEVIPKGQGFATIHGNVINNDQVDLTIPGSLALEWTVESQLYQPEGVTSGMHGYYGTHVFPVSQTDIDFSMFALDQDTGARNWVVRPGQIGQGGTPMILDDPESGEKIVYSGGLRGVFAIDEAGEVKWCTNTGLAVDAAATEDFDTHIKRRLWGMNYHQPSDSVVAVYGDGLVMAFSRETGALRASYQIEGDPSVDNTGLNLPAPLLEGAEVAMRRQFVPEGAQLSEDARIFDTIVAVALGGDMVVSNYYATDPDSDRLWIAATMPDAADGKEDGVARFGALHAINLVPDGDGYEFQSDCTVPFEGGSASTPAVLPGGERIYTSDNDGNALAFNQDCELVWSVNVGDQILGSLAVSPYDHYIYAATGSGVFQIIDHGNSAELGWSAELDGIFSGGLLLLPILQLLTDALDAVGLPLPAELQASNIQIASISENALVMIAGLGLQMDPERSEVFAPLVMTLTIIDRMTGDLINATPAREESIAVTGVDMDGSVVIGNSPLRRGALVGVTEVLGGGLLGAALRDVIPPLTGGVSKYSPVDRFDQAARDAICYSARKVLAWDVNRDRVDYSWADAPESTAFEALWRQSREMLKKGLAAGEVGNGDYAEIQFALQEAKERIESGDYRAAHSVLDESCLRLH